MSKKFEYSKGVKPTSLKDLNKEFMFKYLEEECTPEDIDWFIEITSKYWTTDKKLPNGKECEGFTDINAVRKEFASRFFDYLLKDKPKSSSKSYLDRLKELSVKKKGMQ